MNIYEITGYALELMEYLDAEEIDEQTVADTLEAIGADEKIDSYCKIIKSYENDISNIDNEIARLKARKDHAEKNISRMKTALDNFMQATQKDKVKTQLFTVSYRKSTSVEILDQERIPLQYRNVKIEESPDKSAIKRSFPRAVRLQAVSLRKTKIYR